MHTTKEMLNDLQKSNGPFKCLEYENNIIWKTIITTYNITHLLKGLIVCLGLEASVVSTSISSFADATLFCTGGM